ncbi:hypothetical protein BD779DRAFT_1677353 [Infundibulicybe gibba]|nr:hypothetical protein BD779DRAFT_1677353 [Infundibulicybe gibba]
MHLSSAEQPPQKPPSIAIFREDKSRAPIIPEENAPSAGPAAASGRLGLGLATSTYKYAAVNGTLHTNQVPHIQPTTRSASSRVVEELAVVQSQIQILMGAENRQEGQPSPTSVLLLSTSGVMYATQTDEKWTSSFAGWHSRATPHPKPREFLQDISPASFNIGFLRSTQLDPSGWLQVMGESAIVDALGRVLILRPDDAAGIISLAQMTPPLSNDRVPWAIKSPVTDRPIDSVVVPDGSALTETKVKGFTKATRELQKPVGDISELPHVLWELFGLLLEAREKFDHSAVEFDSEVVDKVKAVIGQAGQL